MSMAHCGVDKLYEMYIETLVFWPLILPSAVSVPHGKPLSFAYLDWSSSPDLLNARTPHSI